MTLTLNVAALTALLWVLGVCADIFIDDLRWLWRRLLGRPDDDS
ncbi:hypothetical protein ABZ912_05415 [Nonomuraea angiospora]